MQQPFMAIIFTNYNNENKNIELFWGTDTT